jgi:tetratricopeptide (TPR) repeat protein
MINHAPKQWRRQAAAGALIVAFTMLAPPAASPAGAADAKSTAAEEQKRYEACMQEAREQPKDGLRTALAWSKAGGGPASRHCAAVATLALGQYRQAATQMEQVSAEKLKEGDTILAAELMGQAGQAWLLARDLERAYAAQTRGLEINPGDVELRIDRGLTLAEQKKYWEALDDFNLAQSSAPNRPDILMWMATAYRKLEAYDLARDMIDEVLRAEPDNPDALLQRGILRHLTGDGPGAIADWQRVVKLADGTPAADAAQANLKRFGPAKGKAAKTEAP